MTSLLDAICRHLRRLCFVVAFLTWITCAQCPADPGRDYWLTGAAYRARIAQDKFEYYSSSAVSPDLVYSFVSISQGGRRIPVPDGPKSSRSGNVVSLDYGSVLTETYTALDHGIEQCWVIHRRPRSSADITIEGTVDTAHRITSSPFGLDLVDGRGRRVCGYGEVTVVDSLGRTFRCLPTFDSGTITIRIPSSYVRSAVFPVLVDPVVGPEVPLCPSYSPARNRQEAISMAASPYGYLAVWQDGRGDNADIFASRISPTGEVLDKAGIAVSIASSDQTNPAVAWNGHDYLVVWADRRSSNPHIYGARVELNGEVLEKQGVLLSGTSGSQSYPRVAGNGASWLVVWQDNRSSNDIYDCTVSADGVPSRTNGLSTRSDNEETPDVAWNGSNYIAVWCDYRNTSGSGSNTDIYGCRVARNGVKVGSDIIVSCNLAGTAGAVEAQKWPRICSYGSTCMVVWADWRRTTTDSDVYGARVNSAGLVLDKGGIPINQADGDQELPCVVYDGNQFLCVWRNNNDDFMLRAARVNVNGGVLDPQGFALASQMAGASGSAAVGASGAFLVGWSSFEPTTGDALCSFVGDNGTVSNPEGIVVSLGLDDQKDYAAAWNGSEYAVVWSQLVNGSYDILGARVSSSGQLLTPTPVNITSSFAGHQTQPAIAWNGSCYLLVWSGSETFATTAWDIRGLRLNSSLGRLDSNPILVCAAGLDQTKPCVTAKGSSFLVAWVDARNAVSPYYYTDIFGAIVSSSSAVTVVSPPINQSTGNQLNPSVASDGSGGFVVWEDYRSGSPLIYGARVSSAGQTLDTTGIALPATYYYQYAPQVCWGQSAYLVSWSDSYKISGCRVAQAGTILDPAGIQIDAFNSYKACPGVCWDGSKFQCAWEDYRSTYSGNSDVYHTTISSTGSVSTNSTVALVSDLAAQLNPKLLAQGAVGMLFYSKYTNFSHCTCACSLTEIPVQEMTSISEAKRASAGTPVAIRDKIVSGAFTGFFYAQERNRSSGIKVISSVPVHKGDVVDVVGNISLADGERVLNAGILSTGSSGVPPKPLGVRGDTAGGGALNAYTPGITGACGANNIGLLIRTWGKVTASGSGCFTIEARPGATLTVISGTLTQPAVGKMVAVTGISTCLVDSGSSTRAVLAREQADIKLLN